MSAYRTHCGLAALLLGLLVGAPAYGQDHELKGMQLFEETDARPYGNWAAPKEGFFFTFDGIFWSISAPDKTPIGADHTTQVSNFADQNFQFTESNSLSTGDFRAKWKQGDRFELGYVSGHNGLMVTTMDLAKQTQYIVASNAFVVLNDQTAGNPRGLGLLQIITTGPDGLPIAYNTPTLFANITCRNRVATNGVEALYMYRSHELHEGGSLEWLMGARYVYFDDDFFLNAFGGTLPDTYIDTDAKNRLVGPEIGVRYAKPFGRFSLSADGRFTAAANSQAIKQRGQLASQLNGNNVSPFPTLLDATGFENSAGKTEFSPIVELRVEAHMEITRVISLKAGWTGVWMDNIARASDMVNYTVPRFGINMDANSHSVLMQGLTLGIELNR